MEPQPCFMHMVLGITNNRGKDKVMFMGKGLYVIYGLLLLSLLGCSKESASHEGDKSQVSSAETTQMQGEVDLQEAEVLEGIRAELGMGEERMWKEIIENGDMEASIKADLKLPDTTKMYSMTVSEYYLTKEDKQWLAQYFMDADSIKVDKEWSVSKELLQQEIEWYDELIQSAQSPDSIDAHMLPLYESEKERLMAAVTNAPGMEDIGEDVGDYSANAYIGSKDNIAYEMRFYVDEERNQSAWTLNATTTAAFLDTDVSSEEITCNNSYMDIGNNASAMTKEEAVEKAVKLCQELGLPAMEAVATYDLEWWVGEQQEYNGYAVTLARTIGGCAADNYRYVSSEKWNGESARLPYGVESVEICLNDKGIIGVRCIGLLTAGELSSPVKLLSFDQIKEILSREVCGEDYADFTGEWCSLTLSYIKWENTEKENEYTYIPVWKLSQWGGPADMNIMMEVAEVNIWINAIDGSRIDPKDIGIVSQDLQSVSYYE